MFIRFLVPSALFLSLLISSAVNAVPAYPVRQLHPSSHRSGFIISEIMYHPSDRLDAVNLEFIELYNTEPVDMDISGYSLAGEVEYTFPAGTIFPARSFIVVAVDPAAIEAEYGISGVYGPVSGSLNNTGGKLQLINHRGAVILDIDYNDAYPWPETADGAGNSLVLLKPDYGENDVKAWGASTQRGGNPGTINAAAFYDICFNEVLANPAAGQTAFIELYNRGDQTLNLQRFYITDDPAILKYQVPGLKTIAPGGFASFSTSNWGSVMSLNPHGGTLYLINPNEQQAVAAIRYRAEEEGVSLGCFPDNTGEFTALASATAGTKNSGRLDRDIIINEIMYNHISGDSNDEYVELYNRGTQPVNVSGWRLSSGISFTIPSNTVIAAEGYLVIARDADRMVARYPALSAANTVGNFDDGLDNRGERIRLSMPIPVPGTNGIYITVNEVTYADGGDWGDWTDGEGSSLELKDPFSDNRFAGSWAGSDETAKSRWTTVQHTGVLDNGGSDADTLELLLHDPGECMVDDISIVKSGETANRVDNGDFESGTSGWTIQGNHIESTVVDNEGVGSSKAMHVKASGSGNNSVNRLKKPLTANLYNGETATISYKARWLHGSRLLLAKLHGNYLEAIEPMDIPETLGSPGEQNSMYAPTSGPVIQDVTHFPVVPDAAENIVVSAFVTDPDGLDTVTLFYRVDPATTYTQVSMNDAGLTGDSLPDDGIYSAQIPGQADSTLVAFYIEATDNNGTPISTRYPSAAPEKECLVRFGDTGPEGIYSSYKIWMTESQVANWRADQRLSNRLQPCTFVYGTFRPVYGAGIRMRGSTWVRSQYYDPINFKCNYLVKVPQADRIQGTGTITLDALEQQDVWSGGVRDTTFMREKMTFWMGERLGIPTLYMRNMHMYINGKKQGLIYAETQQANSDFIKSWFPYNADGHMHEISHWHEYNDGSQVNREWTQDAAIENFTTTGGVKKQARYRWNWKKERSNAADDNYEPLFELVDAVNSLNNYYDTVDPIVDWNEWMRSFAVRQAVCDWDGYGRQNGQNGYMYKPDGSKWNFILFDADTGLGVQGLAPTEDLFLINDPVLSGRFFQNPTFRRAYWRALKDIVDGPFLSTEFNATIDAHYLAFQASGIDVGSPATVKNWVNDRRNYIIGQLNALNSTFEITSNSGNDYSVASPSVTVNGTAPVEVDTITVNGFAYPVTWNDVTTWSISIGLYPGANLLEFQGYDSYGAELGSMFDSITITYAGTETNQASLVINEIMYNPPGNNEEFLELYNASPLYPAKLTDYRLEGIDATFGSNMYLGPESYGVIVENRAAFMELHGSGITILGDYSGKLDNGGERISVLKVDPSSGIGTVVSMVEYDNTWPWPAAADGSGPSLQLVSTSADNRRVANWGVDSVALSTPGRENSISAPLPFAEAWINEVQSDNVTGIVDNEGDNDPWLELYVTFSGEVIVTNEIIVPTGSTWNYKDDGSDQGTAWRAAGFDASGWASGSAELGYGDGGEATVVSFGADSQNKYPTTYFRHYFTVHDASIYSSLILALRRDDGAIVYLNGTEVRRDNCTGTDGYLAYASAKTVGDEETAYYESALDPAYLVDGTNVFAVEVHQESGGSSDISFDVRLEGTIEHDGSDFSGYYLSDTPTNPALWAFPSDTPVSSGMYMVVWVDGEPAESETGSLHTSFRLNTETGSVYLSRIAGGVTQVVDYITYPPLASDKSYGSIPDGEPYSRIVMSVPTPGASNVTATRIIPVVINEWMSANATTIPDPADGTYADWFELFNPATQAVDLSGCILSDGSDDWTVPDTVSIPAEGFLLIWADGEPSQNNGTNGLHANFKLSRDGESIRMSFEGTTIDHIVYGAQADDISHGRWPDGSNEIVMMFPPTPGEPNEIPEPFLVLPILIAGIALFRQRKKM